jgi:acetolactate synthase-1/2/3 large subunit
MPFGIAAAAARPDEPCLVYTGDGAFGLCAIEFETAVRHRLPVVVVVANNGGWGDVRHEQRAFYGEEADQGAILSSDVRYDKLAEALGGRGERVEKPEELAPALKRAIDAGEPTIVDCLTDPDVESELIRGLGTLDVM